jgi:hypothetical protein
MAEVYKIRIPVLNSSGAPTGNYVEYDVQDAITRRALAEAINSLNREIEALQEKMVNLGEAKAKCIDSEDLPKVCGESLVVVGSGAPSVTPKFVGQRYHDDTNRKVYEAFAVTNSVSDWVLLN